MNEETTQTPAETTTPTQTFEEIQTKYNQLAHSLGDKVYRKNIGDKTFSEECTQIYEKMIELNQAAVKMKSTPYETITSAS